MKLLSKISMWLMPALMAFSDFPYQEYYHTQTNSIASERYQDFSWSWYDHSTPRITATLPSLSTSIVFRLANMQNNKAYLTVYGGSLIYGASNTTVTFTLSNSNIPPNQTYYADFMSVGGVYTNATTNGTNVFYSPSRILARGKVTTFWDTFSASNIASYTNSGNVLVFNEVDPIANGNLNTLSNWIASLPIGGSPTNVVNALSVTNPITASFSSGVLGLGIRYGAGLASSSGVLVASGLATGLPVYAESDPVWTSESNLYAVAVSGKLATNGIRVGGLGGIVITNSNGLVYLSSTNSGVSSIDTNLVGSIATNVANGASNINSRLQSNSWAAADSTTNYTKRTGDTVTGQLNINASTASPISLDAPLRVWRGGNGELRVIIQTNLNNEANLMLENDIDFWLVGTSNSDFMIRQMLGVAGTGTVYISPGLTVRDGPIRGNGILVTNTPLKSLSVADSDSAIFNWPSLAGGMKLSWESSGGSSYEFLYDRINMHLSDGELLDNTITINGSGISMSPGVFIGNASGLSGVNGASVTSMPLTSLRITNTPSAGQVLATSNGTNAYWTTAAAGASASPTNVFMPFVLGPIRSTTNANMGSVRGYLDTDTATNDIAPFFFVTTTSNTVQDGYAKAMMRWPVSQATSVECRVWHQGRTNFPLTIRFADGTNAYESALQPAGTANALVSVQLPTSGTMLTNLVADQMVQLRIMAAHSSTSNVPEGRGIVEGLWIRR